MEDQYSAHVSIDGEAVSLDILDTAGQEEYASLQHTFMDQVDGVMLVFSIVDDYTLDEMSNITGRSWIATQISRSFLARRK